MMGDWLSDLLGTAADEATSYGDYAYGGYIPDVTALSDADYADYINSLTTPVADYLVSDTTPSVLSSLSTEAPTSVADALATYYTNATPVATVVVPEATTTAVPATATTVSPTDINATTGLPNYATDPEYTKYAAENPTIMDTLDKYGRMLNSSGGKLLTSLGAAGISAYGAAKQNQILKDAADQQAAAVAAAKAKAATYSAPLRLASVRSATTPTARNGESLWFTNNKLPSYYAKGGAVGALGYVRGGSPGQADKISAKVSDGEYVLDADVVSALGDGNNEAGAKKLDAMRNAIRAQKRSAPASQIPPKAKSPLAYMKGVK